MRFPMFGGLWPIRPRDALRDAFAGLTLASVNIPQVLGYTRIAGTPVVRRGSGGRVADDDHTAPDT